MSDQVFDAVIIGGGNKGLIMGMYLARYGGMSVGIFERRHEAGGGWTTEEGAAPGFLNDCHATSVGYVYQLTSHVIAVGVQKNALNPSGVGIMDREKIFSRHIAG